MFKLIFMKLNEVYYLNTTINKQQFKGVEQFTTEMSNALYNIQIELQRYRQNVRDILNNEKDWEIFDLSAELNTLEEKVTSFQNDIKYLKYNNKNYG